MSGDTLPPLGDVEVAALECLWKRGEADVVEVHHHVGRTRGISVNTVGSALERLFKKKLVLRTKVSHAYRYRAACPRQEFEARRLASAVGGARRLAEDRVLNAFVDLVARVDDEALERLEASIARHRRERSKR